MMPTSVNQEHPHRMIHTKNGSARIDRPWSVSLQSKKFFLTRTLSYVPDLDRSPHELAEWYATDSRLRQFRNNFQARSTVSEYAACLLRRFFPWCESHGIDAERLNGDQVARFLEEMLCAGMRPANGTPDDATSPVSKAVCDRTLTAIHVYNYSRGRGPIDSLRLRNVKRFIRRRVIVRRPALMFEQLVALLEAVDCMPRLRRARDRALFILLWHTALRPNEAVALNVEDLDFLPFGAVVHVVKSKTDQEGAGQSVTIACRHDVGLCPVHSLRDWCAMAGISEGPLFRRITAADTLVAGHLATDSISDVIHTYTRALRLNPRISAYSFRRGSATHAKLRGAKDDDIQMLLRHKSYKSTRVYLEAVPLPVEMSISRFLW